MPFGPFVRILCRHRRFLRLRPCQEHVEGEKNRIFIRIFDTGFVINVQAENES